MTEPLDDQDEFVLKRCITCEHEELQHTDPPCRTCHRNSYNRGRTDTKGKWSPA